MKFKSRKSVIWLLCAAASVCTGCGPGDKGYVNGRVTLDGNPVEKARVHFHPVGGGRMSQGVTGANGDFELRYTIDEKGALIGEHKVVISTGEPVLDDKTGREYFLPEVIPAKYNKNTTLTANVKAGNNPIDFELTSK